MSAQIRRRNDRSKLVEQEFGRRMYATDLPYEEAMDQLTQKYLDSVKLIKQSEFKKPYLEDDYVPMEYSYNPPGWPGWAPATPGDSIIPDCRVGVEAAGALEDWRNCAEGNSCAGYVFTCAHKLISIGCGNCTITKIEPLEGDRLMVIICSDRDTLDIKVQTTQDPSKPATWESFEEKRTCCSASGISIGYTSQQMSCSDTQTLTAVPATDAESCWTWAITAGGGTLSATTGKSVIYTAPATNAECANNPTITLTNKAGATATLQIAINCAGAGYLAYGIVLGEGANCTWTVTRYNYQCDASASTPSSNACEACDCSACGNCCCDAADCTCTGPCGSGVPFYDFVCTLPCVQARCSDGGICGGNCSDHTIDLRDAAAKTAGCCPAALL